MRPDKNFRQDFIAACAAARGRARRQEVGPQGELLVSLNRVTVGGAGGGSEDPWVGQAAYLGGLPAPLVILSAGPCADTSEIAVGLWPFCILLFIIAPTAHACSYFQSPTVSLYSLAQADICSGASPSVEGPRSSCLKMIFHSQKTLLLGYFAL